MGEPSRALAPPTKYGAWGWSIVLAQGPRVLALAGMREALDALARLNAALDLHGAEIAAVAAVAGTMAGTWRFPRDDWRATTMMILTVYVVTPALAVQWLVWALPFLCARGQRDALVYTAACTTFILGSYWQWTLNGKYGVHSLTRSLHVLAGWELAGVVLVGVFGVLCWAWCVFLLRRTWTR